MSIIMPSYSKYSNGSASSVLQRVPLWIPFPDSLLRGSLERAADFRVINVTAN